MLITFSIFITTAKTHKKPREIFFNDLVNKLCHIRKNKILVNNIRKQATKLQKHMKEMWVPIIK